MKPKQKGETASYKKPNRIFLHYAPKAPSFCHHNPLYIDLSQRKSLYSISSARKPTFNKQVACHSVTSFHLLFRPLAPSFSEAVMISSDTVGVILSGALPREDSSFSPFPNSPIP